MIVAVKGRQSGKSVVAEYFVEQYERLRLALIEALEQGSFSYDEETEHEPEEEPENNFIGIGKHNVFARQLPEGHRIPWYTSGFQ